MKTVTLNLLSISELNKEAKNIAIEQHRDFLVESYRDDMFDDSFNMTRSKYTKSLTKQEVIEDIEANEYLYFPNGEMANITYYCGKHEKAGQTELKLFGAIYSID